MIPKFRVFEKDRKIMCEVEELGFGENGGLQKVHYYWEEYGEYLSTSEIDDVILMQFTGIKDKNGVDIFEHSELDGAYEVIFKDLKYKLRYIPNNDIIDLHDYWRDKNGEIEVTREYTKV